MRKAKERERAEGQGFKDALVYGRHDPFHKPDHIKVAYAKGFKEGERVVERIVSRVKDA